jgi:hypothetical protein
MYGALDNMRAVNVNDQKMKFNNMRQGDREYSRKLGSLAEFL